jgi:hypothetical protein
MNQLGLEVGNKQRKINYVTSALLPFSFTTSLSHTSFRTYVHSKNEINLPEELINDDEKGLGHQARENGLYTSCNAKCYVICYVMQDVNGDNNVWVTFTKNKLCVCKYGTHGSFLPSVVFTSSFMSLG